MKKIQLVFQERGLYLWNNNYDQIENDYVKNKDRR